MYVYILGLSTTFKALTCVRTYIQLSKLRQMILNSDFLTFVTEFHCNNKAIKHACKSSLLQPGTTFFLYRLLAVLEITVGHRPFSEQILVLTDHLLVYSAIWLAQTILYYNCKPRCKHLRKINKHRSLNYY